MPLLIVVIQITKLHFSLTRLFVLFYSPVPQLLKEIYG
jgi:hypothetical protein